MRTLSFLFVLLASQMSWACSCIEPQRACEALRSAAVFVGTVIETKPIHHKADERGGFYFGYTMRFATEEVFKGEVGREVQIETGNGGGDCGTPLSPNKRYLIHAYRADDGSLWTGLCMGNSVLEHDADSEALLKSYRAMAKNRGSIFGTAAKMKPKWNEDRDDVERGEPVPAAGMFVVAKSERSEALTRVRDDGTYEFNDLEPGKYKLIPTIDAGWDVAREDDDKFEAEVTDGACSPVSFLLFPATRIKGKVIFPPETKDHEIEVVALPTDLKDAGQYSGKWDFTNKEDGSFDLWPLPPGDYFVGVNINNSPKADTPFPPTYYPGVTSESAASVIRIQEGEVREIELPLPEVAKERRVNFLAVTSEGKPLKHVYVQLEDLRHPGGASSYVNVDLDANGRGELNVFQGYSYHLHASQFITYGQQWCSQAVAIPAGEKEVTVRFVLKNEKDCDMERVDGRQQDE